jgi:hypothetical protein
MYKNNDGDAPRRADGMHILPGVDAGNGSQAPADDEVGQAARGIIRTSSEAWRGVGEHPQGSNVGYPCTKQEANRLLDKILEGAVVDPREVAAAFRITGDL